MGNKTLTLLAAAWLGLAFAGPPSATASPVMDFGKANPQFVSTGGTSQVNLGGITVHCTAAIGQGQWTTTEYLGSHTGSTGTVQIAFKGCRISNAISCTTPGAPVGEIKSEELVFHLAYIKGFSKTVGMLFTNNATTGRFSVAKCGNVTGDITGNGLIAHLESPNCGDTSSSLQTVFASTVTGVPVYQEIEGSATKYSWLWGSSEAAASAAMTTTLEPGVSATLTCN